jgi:hypothetical protein
LSNTSCRQKNTNIIKINENIVLQNIKDGGDTDDDDDDDDDYDDGDDDDDDKNTAKIRNCLLYEISTAGELQNKP